MLKKIIKFPLTVLRAASESLARIGRGGKGPGKKGRRKSKKGSSPDSTREKRSFGLLKKLVWLGKLPLDLVRRFSNYLTRQGKRLETKTRRKNKSAKQGGSNKFGRTKKLGPIKKRIIKAAQRVVSPLVGLANSLENLVPKGPKPNLNLTSDRGELRKRVAQLKAKRERIRWWKNSWPVKVIRFCSPPFVFFWTLIKTRDPALFWWAIPILLVFGGLGVIVYQTAFVDARRIAARYEFATAEAIKAGEFQTAEVFQRKLEQLGISTDQGEFRQAFEIGAAGDMEDAAERMRRLASPDKPGHPGAHFWLAQNLIDETLDGFPPPTNFQRAMQHVEHLKVLVGVMPEVQFVEAITLARLGLLDEASAAFGESPVLYLDAAATKLEVELARGDMSAARIVAISVQRHISQLKDEEKVLTDEQFQLDIKSAQLLDDANAVALAIKNWYELNPDSDEARLYSAAIRLREIDKWLRQPDRDSLNSEADKLVDVSREIPAKHVDLVRRRLNTVSRGRDNPIVDSFYETLLSSPDLTGNSVEFFGTAATVKGEWETADKLFVIAAERDAEHSKTWNNWAYVIDNGFPDRRSEGLRYAETATEIEPDNADYRETRGTLLLHLERWQEATEQLEIALNGLAKPGPIHRSLAVAYEKLGNSRLADLHRRESER